MESIGKLLRLRCSQRSAFGVETAAIPRGVCTRASLPDFHVSIDLQRPGRVPDRIAAFDAREGKVSRGEYRRALGLVQKA
jgi:hypothetical protein